MANLEGFDATKHEPNSGFDVMPAGEYDAVIVASEMKDTADKSGKYLKLELQILNGEFQNRKVWDNLNLVNNGKNKEKTEQIAKGTLSAICRAVNVLTPKDSAELHNKPLRIKLAIDKDPQYGDKNVVKAYKPRSTAVPTAPVPTASDSTWTSPASSPEASKTPW